LPLDIRERAEIDDISVTVLIASVLPGGQIPLIVSEAREGKWRFRCGIARQDVC
jgi:hypothetical protein